MDTTTGVAHAPTIHAAATLTLALPKQGLLTPAAKQYVGELYLADICVPPELYSKIGVIIPNLFAQDDLIRIG